MAVASFPSPPDADLIVVTVREPTERSIMDDYANAKGFPEYFSKNFDSLSSCIADVLAETDKFLVLLHTFDFDDEYIPIYARIMKRYAKHQNVLQIKLLASTPAR